jgi:hypothetical protein
MPVPLPRLHPEHLGCALLLSIHCSELFSSPFVCGGRLPAEGTVYEGGILRQARRFTVAVLATVLGTLLLSFPSRSFAGQVHRWDLRHDRYDMRHDRRDLRRDWRDIGEDRRELRHDRREHDWQDVRRDRRDLGQDWRDIRHDRHDLRADRRDFRSDLH